MEIDSVRTSQEPVEMVPAMTRAYPPRDPQDLFREECCIESCTEEGQEESCWGRFCALVACLLCPICRLIDDIMNYFLGEEEEISLQKQPRLDPYRFFNPFSHTKYQEPITSFLKDAKEGLKFPCQIELVVRIYPDCRSEKRYTFKLSHAYGKGGTERFTQDFDEHLKLIADQLQANNIALDFKTKIGIVIHATEKSASHDSVCFAIGTSISALSTVSESSECSQSESRNLMRYHLKQIDQPTSISEFDWETLTTLQEQLQAERS
jgi:hypothetical protein